MHLENALLIHLNWDETSNLHYIQGNYTLWCCRALQNYINKYSLSMVIGTVAFDCSLRTTVHKLLHLSDSSKPCRHKVWMVQTFPITNNFFQWERRGSSARGKGWMGWSIITYQNYIRSLNNSHLQRAIIPKDIQEKSTSQNEGVI